MAGSKEGLRSRQPWFCRGGFSGVTGCGIPRRKIGGFTMKLLVAVGLLGAMTLATAAAAGESSASSPAKQVRDDFMDVDRRIMDMAKDWPADKYDYKMRPEMRTFGAVLVH